MTDEFDPVAFGNAVKDVIREATAPLLKRIEELEARQPERGEKGDTGPAGDPGRDADPVLASDVVAELVKSDALAPVLDLYAAEAVAKHFEANPVQHGKDGRDGPQGPSGEKGDPGANGIGLAGALIDRDGSLVVTLTDGTQKSLGPVVGKDGQRGDNGADGFGFDDLSVDYDGERGLTLTFTKGERVKEFKLDLPVMIHRGFYADGMSFKAADTVTHDGNLWYAKRDTSAKPSHENKEDWQLAARKGRDGDRGQDGKDYQPPKPVKLKGDKDA